ncbi:MAG: cytochrome-c oxidase, cbb3-type subunit II, partial [Planctomycetota bacterium]
WHARVGGGLLYVAGVVMLAVNYFMTWRSRPKTYDEPVYRARRLVESEAVDPQPARSRLEGANVLEIGHTVSRFSQLVWHRKWERLPVFFPVATTAAVVVATLFEVVPTFLIRSNVPTISTVRPYTPLELAGRDIYVAEGCYNCHSQMIRPLVAETKRFGDYSLAGEFIYDRPFQWGSRRIGPDLAREGGKQSDMWHLTHFENPEEYSPGSVMPAYQHLIDEKLNYNRIPERVRNAELLGAPYEFPDEEAIKADAKRQAAEIAQSIVAQNGPAGMDERTVIALIAYLQRLGTDRYKTTTTDPADVDTPAELLDPQQDLLNPATVMIAE